MFEEYQICPYTGLRSFTEEESLYFKGREEHIDQATEQLQRNKFLMLTGASGDGKSSLVYAGIVPNARAGFLKSKYTQWCVADFRPERTPFKNLCKSLARQLNIPNQTTVESELQHGFSALVDLYKNSGRYVDVESSEWTQADDPTKAALKREAANLIVIVDQFEEFFTNPENYHKGVPSRDSNLVLNILLETARIALDEDLPIYVVFTMRSDYIGQCAAFRSLPEYIGFSQFFVPRLNRTQLQQVIEEPALLSGNKITRRLTERLIHDIAEGVDQLPILQHALNQVWHAANSGTEEMDLVHYAMVGGLPAEELPDEHVEPFRKWFDKLTPRVKACYHKPSLQNVLDTHANKLYESAAESYKNKVGKNISDEIAKEIVKKTFICLTKIDQSRAVRNRMTVREIWDIINRKDVDIETVGWVLNVFREPGNTFIRPFITEEVETGKLKEDDVLDITHESLIRNWVLLEEWAKEEFTNYTIFLDFEQQLGRWVESERQGGFLLSIGPLTYFENWYKKASPNSHWIARYLPEGESQDSKLTKARTIRDNSREFLSRSARKHMVTRTIMRYGPRKIAAVFAVIAIITLSSFALNNYIKRQNDYVLDQIERQTYALANSRKANFYDKSILFAEQLKSGRITVPELIAHVNDPIQKLNVASRLAAVLAFQGQGEPEMEIAASLKAADSALFSIDVEHLPLDELRLLFKEVSYLRAVNEATCFFSRSEELQHYKNRTGEFSKNLVMHVYKTKPLGFEEMNQLHVLMENAINQKSFSESELDFIIETLSPFDNHELDAWITERYSDDKLMVRGSFNYGLRQNGLYQELAYLYAAKGEEEKALQCIDSLLRYQQNLYQQDYTSFIDNATNISVVFYKYGHDNQFRAFGREYARRKGISEIEYYQRLIGRCDVRDPTGASMNEFAGPILINMNCQMADVPQLKYLYRNYRQTLEQRELGKNERNFLLALAFKDEAIMRYNVSTLGRDERDSEVYYELLDQAFDHYRRVDESYLLERVQTARYTDSDAILKEHKYQFLYPDFRPLFNVSEPRRYETYYSSGLFARYLLDKKLLAEFYHGPEYQYFVDWLDAHALMCGNFFNGRNWARKKVDVGVLVDLEAHISSNTDLTDMPDLNLLYLQIGSGLGTKGEVQLASNYYERVKEADLVNYFRNPQLDWDVYCQVVFASKHLAQSGNIDRVYELVQALKEHSNRSSLYGFVAAELLQFDPADSMGLRLLDSATVELSRIEGRSIGPHRINIAAALALQGPERYSEESYKMIKNVFNKFDPIQRICRAYALRGLLFDAEQTILPNSSDSDLGAFLWNIVYANNLVSGVSQPEWDSFSDNYQDNYTRWIGFIGENN